MPVCQVCTEISLFLILIISFKLEYLTIPAEVNQLTEQKFQNTMQSLYPQLKYRRPGINKNYFIYLFTFAFIVNYWSDAHNRKNFFIEFAAQKGFDPLLAENWENVQIRKEVNKQVKKKKIA